MIFLGSKNKAIFDELINPYLPNLENYVYVEPFGGSFKVADLLTTKPKKKIYNDINKYNINITADVILYEDYKRIINDYDSENTFFYCDPPFFEKEFLYDSCKHYTMEFHIELHDILKKIKGKFVLSYENKKFILNLYKDFKIITYIGEKTKFKNDILILNY